MTRKREPILALGKSLRWWADLLERQEDVLRRIKALEARLIRERRKAARQDPTGGTEP